MLFTQLAEQLKAHQVPAGAHAYCSDKVFRCPHGELVFPLIKATGEHLIFVYESVGWRVRVFPCLKCKAITLRQERKDGTATKRMPSSPLYPNPPALFHVDMHPTRSTP